MQRLVTWNCARGPLAKKVSVRVFNLAGYARCLTKPNSQQHHRSMNPLRMTPPRARLELALLQSEADVLDSETLYVRFRDMKLPPEVAMRLKALLAVTKEIGGKVVSVGKIIAIHLIEFVKTHPNLAVGVAIGAALSSLITSIPFLGPLLAPITLPLGILVGAIAGHRVDKAQGAHMQCDVGMSSITQDLIEIAQDFFAMVIATFLAIFEDIER